MFVKLIIFLVNFYFLMINFFINIGLKIIEFICYIIKNRVDLVLIIDLLLVF